MKIKNRLWEVFIALPLNRSFTPETEYCDAQQLSALEDRGLVTRANRRARGFELSDAGRLVRVAFDNAALFADSNDTHTKVTAAGV